jgi:DNA-binding GntR family transcriptional regulator
MSLLPVAEALQGLERDGLVESRPRVGTRVCLPTPTQIEERYEIHEALEAQAARLYAERATLRQKREMQRMAEHMDALFNRLTEARSQDREFLYAVHSYHLDLHLRIAEYAGCAALREIIEKNHVLIFNWLFDVAASRPPLPRMFHRNLVETLNRGKVESADRAMREHVRHGRSTVVENIGPRSRNLRFERVK